MSWQPPPVPGSEDGNYLPQGLSLLAAAADVEIQRLSWQTAGGGWDLCQKHWADGVCETRPVLYFIQSFNKHSWRVR